MEDTSTDHDLLSGSVQCIITENRAAAARAAVLVEYHRRLAARQGVNPKTHFTLTARNTIEIEISELWATPKAWVRRELNAALWIDEHFPYLRDLAAAGHIDAYRVRLINDAARSGLDTDEEWARFADRLIPFLERHRRKDEPGQGMVTCTPKQLRNRIQYLIKQIRAADAEATFRMAHEGRDVVVSDGDAGMSWLTIGGTTDQIALAAHRLTLSAQQLRADGDPRTVEQIRADLALGLITGTVDGSTTLPAYARPITNLTVPLQTVMGLSDEPGVLSGGQVIPAGLARTIAQTPGGTWHRMLTDPAGRCVEVSTERYRPTRALWEQVVARDTTCFRSGCDQASTTVDLDHRTEWPAGPTSTINLEPGCRNDHRAKHSLGFAITQDADGSFRFTTPAGFSHPTTVTDHPSSVTWPEVEPEIQFSPTEILEAITSLRLQRRAERPDRPDLQWEFDISAGRQHDDRVFESAV